MAILQSIPQLLLIGRANGRQEFANQRWCDYTGSSRNEDPEGWLTYFHPEDQATVRSALQNSLEAGAEHQLHCRVRRRDDVFRWHLAHSAPIRDEVGNIQKWFVTLTHIHDCKKSEAALLQMQKLASLGRMAATIAHEINNPLASLRNVAHLVPTMGPLNREQARLIAVLNSEVVRVAQIVQSTLGLARQGSTPAPVDVAELVASVLKLFQRRLEAQNIKVITHYESVRGVNTIASELRQVIANLCSNAIDAMPFGGQLTLRVRSARDWRGHGHQMLRISIADTGSGIPKELQHHVFEAFVSTKGEMGTGLGLWVSRSIVEKHGGRIRFRSPYGARRTGTLFCVFLPFDHCHEARPHVAY